MRTMLAVLGGALLALPIGSLASSSPSSVVTTGLGTADWTDSPLWLGRYGSQANDVSVRGRTAFAAIDAGLEAWDVDPVDGSARRLGSVALDPQRGWTTALVVDGSLACISYGPGGLWTVDVTDPSAPAVVGSLALADYAHDIALAGDLACVATTNGIHLVDVSQPDVPRSVAHLSTGAPARLSLAGTLLYVSDPVAGLVIWDVSNPAQPVAVGTLALMPGSGHVTANGSRAFVARTGGSVDMIDVSSPSHPHLLRSISVGTGPGKVTIRGARLYIPDFTTGEIHIWNWRRGAMLANTYVAHVPGRCEVTDADQLVVSGRGGFDVIRLDEPRNEGPLAHIAVQRTALIVAAEGDLVAAGDRRVALFLDARDPRRPVPLPVPLPGYFIDDLALRRSIAYIGTAHLDSYGGVSRELITVDLSRPEDARILSSVPVIWSDGLVSWNDGLVAVTGGGKIQPVASFVDATDPTALRSLGSYALPDSTRRAWIQPGPDGAAAVAFAARPRFGLEIIDLSGNRPRYLASIPLPGGAADLVVRDGVALVAGGDFHAVDVGDPTHPFLITTIGTPGDAGALSVDRDIAYVADHTQAAVSGGIVAIDVTDPHAPFALGAVPTGGRAVDVAASNDLVWVADGIAGLSVIGGQPQSPAAAPPSARRAAPGSGAPALSLLGPNPLNGGAAAFGLSNPLGRAVSVMVCDVRGRRVRSLASGAMPAGDRVLTWDGRDAAGHPVSAGVYFVRLQAGDATSAEKIVVRSAR